MPQLDQTFLEQQVLTQVNKPARYLGMEMGAFRKPPESVAVRMAMIFPDLYEIGVSNYGHKLLYSLVNNRPEYLCDRAYAPAQDMRDKLRELNLPLFGIETRLPLKEFELLAFTLQYELNYTTILGVLDAAHIPFRAEYRPDWITPILIAGGPGSANPKPLAPFFDAFILGDGEDVLLEVLETIDRCKNREGLDKEATRLALAKLEGVYVPGVSRYARKRIVDISQQQVELAPLIPYIQTVHDRVTIEARRGCDRMCRFCQPCFINLPVREQKIETIRDQALKEIEKTGYEECSLLSLSIADYSQLKPLIHEVANALNEKGVSLSLPSQRADRFDVEVAEAVQQVRKSTLTFAPEAGTERLRTVVNKNLTEKEILNAVMSAYKSGWNKIKLYFILGLPTETDADLVGIADLVHKIQTLCAAIPREEAKSRKKHLDINITFSNFVPKPHTPFQWFPQDSMAELNRKRELLRQLFKSFRGIKLNFTDPEISKLEALISKGDERMADIIEAAYRKGAYLDAWEENFLFKEWFEALRDAGIDPDEFTATAYTRPGEPLPWDDLHMGIDADWLRDEYRKSMEVAASEPCFIGCNTCGVCADYNVQPVFMKPSEMARFKAKHETVTDKETLFPLPQHKVRLKIQKRGSLKYISHLDWLRMLQRAVVRAKLPIAYSQGFNPTSKVSFGPALPMFTEGLEEYVDLEMVAQAPDIVSRLNARLPSDGQVLAAEWIPLSAPSLDKTLQSVIYSCRWTCTSAETRYTIHERVQALFEQSAWIVDVKRKSTRQQLDIKPFIQDIQVCRDDELRFAVKIDRQHPMVKPDWFLQLLDPQALWDIKRLQVVLDKQDQRVKV